jgi:hypothetical protein
MADLLQDARYSCGMLWKNRGFTAVAVATLTLRFGMSKGAGMNASRLHRERMGLAECIPGS